MPESNDTPPTRPQPGQRETRGHQPIKARPSDAVEAGYQPSTSQLDASPPKPPSQGSSGKK